MTGERGAADPVPDAESSADAAARELAVVLHDLAWLLPGAFVGGTVEEMKVD